MNGKLDTTQHNQEATDKIEKWLALFIKHGEDKNKNVVSMPHKVQKPELTDDERKALQEKVKCRLIDTIGVERIF